MKRINFFGLSVDREVFLNWAAAIAMVLMVWTFLAYAVGCATKKPVCTWYCGNWDKVPESCGCMEDVMDEVKRK